MSFADTTRGKIYYEDTGWGVSDNREVVLFFNGWSISARYWIPVIDRLSSQYRCLSFDQSGTGRTVCSHSCLSFSVEGFADEASELLVHLGLLGSRKLHIVGHSMGGMIATEICNRHPESLVSATIVNCGIFDDELLKSFHHVLVGGMIDVAMLFKGVFLLEPFKSLFIDRAIGRPIDQKYRTVFVEDFVASDTRAATAVGKFAIDPEIIGKYTAEAVKIGAPLLCVVGMADRTIPPEGMQTLYNRRIEQSDFLTRLARFDHAGHLPMLEVLPEFEQALRNHFYAASKLLG
ncbi:alpha/beta fold hydrolase [Chlorobium phaeobacteroides]|uniref:Alpha/beta hydrolase fold protein n=1 Tax=Chlorobium phaeobacteroides (strain DSM 266 / SMG 266 / 2430) TaxID=290317 RepID=A1BCX5_CHLPD|nr:alpha/beta hydrolase [Chlorobium phaeobacteroides]ABL64252.1 alpha/beta hydrolase fold protein [Chlorobium phaeobacteroides DSM 266]